MKLLPIAATALALAACSGPAPDTRNDGSMTSVGSIENGTPATTDVVPADEGTMNVAGNTAIADASGNMTTTAAPDYTGRWIGVEGMVLDVKAAGAPGRYRLTMQWDLDNKGTFDGTAKGDTIVFDRKGVSETLRPTDGDATGLKYLAGKTTCLTVKTGEGYCRA